MLPIASPHVAFLGYPWVPCILTALAVAELVSDQLPSTPSRTVPVQFGTRVLLGGLSGATLAIAGGASWVIALLLGAVGAVIGTFGGAAFRARIARHFGRDWPAALIEDGIAIGSAVLIVMAA